MRSLRGALIGVLSALLWSSCGPTPAHGPECWVVAPPTGGAEVPSAEVTHWVETLRADDPSDHREEHRKAVVALGKLGPAAWAATGALYNSLAEEDLFEVVDEGSYVDLVTGALAAISREKAVAQSLAAFKGTEGNDRAAARLIWATVLRKVGKGAVPCLCDLATSAEAPEVVAYYVMVLQMLADHGALAGHKEMAHDSLTKLTSHADPGVREAATEALKSF